MDDNKVRPDTVLPGERVVEGRHGEVKGGEVRGEVKDVQRIAQERLVTGHNLSASGERVDHLDKLTLHEERARVEVVREQAGAVSIRKVVVERTETIPVTLTRETLEITVQPGAGRVLLDGKELEPGQSYEVLVKDERALVQKEVYAISDVTLHKQMQQLTHTEQVTLRREELEVLDPQGLVREVTEG